MIRTSKERQRHSLTARRRNPTGGRLPPVARNRAEKILERLEKQGEKKNE